MTEPQLLLLWGKTCRDADDPDAASKYHPLAFHLFDVAHATLALWDEWMSETWKQRIAAALGTDARTARLLVAVLAGAHDIGKATPPFQFQPTPLDWLRERLLLLGLRVPPDPRPKPHNFVSTRDLREVWREGLWRWKADPKRVASVLAHLTGAHHGTFPTASDYSSWAENELGDEGWRSVRLELLSLLTEEFWPDELEIPPLRDWTDLGAVSFLAGLISVADWIGSSTHFSLAGHRDKMVSLNEYLPLSRGRAREALDDFGFAPTPHFSSPRPDFGEFWKFAPNPLQCAVIAATQEVNAPFLLLCEAPMGCGKTEAALWAADAAWGERRASGLYVALPTQATSNAMHDRVRTFLEKRLPGEVVHLQLVHGNARLRDDDAVWKPLSRLYEEGSGDPDKARVLALSWFSGAKRPLLAPFGVGTIDQSLLAGLQTRHFFVRLFALAGKVVVFDEVHAYDTYMSELLAVLLGWLRELGCSVVLLSATLPSSKRRELLRAWGAALPLEEAVYPRLTWCGEAKTARSIPVEGAEMAPKSVAVSFGSPEGLTPLLRDKLREGGCAAIICNTVAQAQALFEELQRELGDFIKPKGLMLFHARMPFRWRQRIETKVRRLFGKRKAMRPHRAIVVSTQVLEQSLDIDFDWMASFHAPTDLLLQRVGRLHRHVAPEGEPPLERHGLDEPELLILAKESGEAPPSFGPSEWVYEREVLLRSWLLWRGKDRLNLPGEIEPLIEATYEQDANAPSTEWKEALDAARLEREAAQERSRQNAGNVVVPSVTARGNAREARDFVDASSRDLRDDDDPLVHEALRAKTREDAQSITVICLCQDGGNFFLPTPDGSPDRDSPVDLSLPPSPDRTRKLMLCSVPLSHRGICATLAHTKVPDAWKKSPVLRHVRPLAFVDGVAQVGEVRLRLDGKLGIVIEKKGAEKE